MSEGKTHNKSVKGERGGRGGGVLFCVVLPQLKSAHVRALMPSKQIIGQAIVYNGAANLRSQVLIVHNTLMATGHCEHGVASKHSSVCKIYLWKETFCGV